MPIVYISAPKGLRKVWWKHVTGTEPGMAKRGGYAIVGEFLGEGEHDLPLGAVVVRGHARGYDKYACLFVVRRGGGLEHIRTGEADEDGEYSLSKQIHTIMDLCETHLRLQEREGDDGELGRYHTERLLLELQARRPLGRFSTEELLAEIQERQAPADPVEEAESPPELDAPES